MIFATNGGNFDILIGDYVQVSDSCFNEISALMDNYHQVISINALNTKQVQIKYTNSSGVISNVWIDTTWLLSVLRPILPS